MASKEFYELSALDLTGQEVHFDRYRRKVVLIVNVASLGSKGSLEYPILNELQCDFGKDNFAIVAFPCNQFRHQENLKNDEILDFLRYIRPGNNYTPNYDIFQKVDVNGVNSHTIFKFLRSCLPFPVDNPMPMTHFPRDITWSPVERSDVAWNFEKFLIGSEGIPYKRFSSRFDSRDLRNDIEELIAKICS